MNWTKIELKEHIVYRDGGTWYKIKLLKRIKGVAMAEVERFSTSIMRRVDELPESVQQQIAKQIAELQQDLFHAKKVKP